MRVVLVLVSAVAEDADSRLLLQGSVVAVLGAVLGAVIGRIARRGVCTYTRRRFLTCAWRGRGRDYLQHSSSSTTTSTTVSMK